MHAPSLAPDGRLLVFEKRGGGYLTDPNYSENPGIYFTETSGGPQLLLHAPAPILILDLGNDRIFLNVFEDNQPHFSNLNGNDN